MKKLESLTQLTNIVADWFSQAESKEDIDRLTAIKNAVEKVEEEATNKIETLAAENKEILVDYKKLAQHTSFANTTAESGRGPEDVCTLEEILSQNAIKR